ncbi:Predicted acylesterase/phospholipase RssA, contains patatin domain [Stigmatella aurantiaca]|uniref:Predicted acylesterase/phospholipase RssA, contains patatin domain n=1 Tax=Stigmatella aurantiaca TaxID=41 RepID=A0A1H7YA78_STIAU|nr:patatin-like phospholipase family protein [Stigmatella aurantiaca]SEM42801.1 Predicted acylesterase/phospholipase RssA, contains patatin domain [Stigmatella aurantiaca]
MSDDATPSPAPGSHGPLGPLALALSGGGYRAAAFHLGALRFLDRMDLLRDVVALSTVSGGTITGMAWTVSLLDGKPFQEFYETYASYLKRTNVIHEALEGLTAHREHGSHAWASLIRSAADVYARPDLLGDRRFGELLDTDKLPLQEVIFNTTEFHSGLDFRFRRSAQALAPLGNMQHRLPRSVAQHVRLADMVAASSCFPGGFEPLVFPQQFHWPPDYPLPAALQELGADFEHGLPLMDGGIYDNQGIDSLLLAFRADAPPALIISDVSTEVSEIYNVPKNPTRRGWVSLQGIYWMGWGLFVLAMVSALILAWNGASAARMGDWTWKDSFLYLVPSLLSAAVASGLFWVRRRLGDIDALLRKQVEVDAWPSFRKLTVNEFSQMLALRIGSLLALTSSVFMKRVRGLIFKNLYRTPAYAGRRISNLISKLCTNQPALFAEHPWMQPKPHLVQLGQQASQMPTTLWFTQDEQFVTVESAGEATLCYVLLRHILRHHKGLYETEGLPLAGLFGRLRKEWAVFNQEASASGGQPKGAA